MTLEQILWANLAFVVLIGIVYTHSSWDKIRSCYGMWFTREYWTDYNTVEFLSWAAKAVIIVPGLIFGISVWWLFFLTLFYFVDPDLGFEPETPAHSGRIQHYLGMDQLHGLGTAFNWLNISTRRTDSMAVKRFLLPMARNTVTGEAVKTQDLNGVHFQRTQSSMAKMIADKLAEDLTARTGQLWVGFLKPYNPGENLPK